MPCCILSLLVMPTLGFPVCECLLWPAVFKLADNICVWPFRKWVAVMPCCVLSLLTMPAIGTPDSRWLLLCLTVFEHTDDICPWLFREWVAATHHSISSLLTMPILGSPVSKWLLSLTVFQPCSWYLLMALQMVGICHDLLYIKPANNTCLDWSQGEQLYAFHYFMSANDACPGSTLIILIPDLLACACMLFFKPSKGVHLSFSRL